MPNARALVGHVPFDLCSAGACGGSTPNATGKAGAGGGAGSAARAAAPVRRSPTAATPR